MSRLSLLKNCRFRAQIVPSLLYLCAHRMVVQDKGILQCYLESVMHCWAWAEMASNAATWSLLQEGTEFST